MVAWSQSSIGTGEPYDAALLRSPSPEPRQVFGIGLNYRAHADESGVPHPDFPPTFTKFPSSIGGPDEVVLLPSENVDFEVELVVVIGRHSHHVSAADAWQHVAGVCIGQDLSERVVQMEPPVPQFNLGKSFPGFAPMGPWIVTVDELDDPDDLPLSCHINGELMQESRSSDLIFSVPQLFEILTAITPFMPGDVIFTGTPQGVGQSRDPKRFLRQGRCRGLAARHSLRDHDQVRATVSGRTAFTPGPGSRGSPAAPGASAQRRGRSRSGFGEPWSRPYTRCRQDGAPASPPCPAA